MHGFETLLFSGWLRMAHVALVQLDARRVIFGHMVLVRLRAFCLIQGGALRSPPGPFSPGDLISLREPNGPFWRG
jgi:hypothetical protein